MGNYIVDRLIEEIAPWRCVLCQQPARSMDLCTGCREDLPWLEHACGSCALPLPAGPALCGRCLTAPPDTDRCCAAFLYEYPVDRLIAALKFQRRLHLARTLGELLTLRLAMEFAAAKLSVPDVVLPVPLHPKRLATRSFNQAAEIAAWVTQHFGFKLHRSLAERVKSTTAQTGLSRHARLRNMHGAFALTGNVAGQRVAIVDDVITTGATTSQLAALCKENGAIEVQVWAVARTPS